MYKLVHECTKNNFLRRGKAAAWIVDSLPDHLISLPSLPLIKGVKPGKLTNWLISSLKIST